MSRLTMYEGNFLKGDNLPLGKAVPVVIKSVAEANTVFSADKRKVDKAVIYFEGTDRGLIMNKTHYDVIDNAYGPDTANWIGKTVLVQRMHLLRCQHGRETFYNVACVRVVPTPGTKITMGLALRLGSPQPFTEEEAEKARTEDLEKRSKRHG